MAVNSVIWNEAFLLIKGIKDNEKRDLLILRAELLEELLKDSFHEDMNKNVNPM